MKAEPDLRCPAPWPSTRQRSGFSGLAPSTTPTGPGCSTPRQFFIVLWVFGGVVSCIVDGFIELLYPLSLQVHFPNMFHFSIIFLSRCFPGKLVANSVVCSKLMAGQDIPIPVIPDADRDTHQHEVFRRSSQAQFMARSTLFDSVSATRCVMCSPTPHMAASLT